MTDFEARAKRTEGDEPTIRSEFEEMSSEASQKISTANTCKEVLPISRLWRTIGAVKPFLKLLVTLIQSLSRLPKPGFYPLHPKDVY
jgi:hypothetical protein